MRRRSALRPSAPESVLLLVIRARSLPRLTAVAGEQRWLTCNRREVNPGTGSRRSWGASSQRAEGPRRRRRNAASVGTQQMLVETTGGSRFPLPKPPARPSPRRVPCALLARGAPPPIPRVPAHMRTDTGSVPDVRPGAQPPGQCPLGRAACHRDGTGRHFTKSLVRRSFVIAPQRFA